MAFLIPLTIERIPEVQSLPRGDAHFGSLESQGAWALPIVGVYIRPKRGLHARAHPAGSQCVVRYARPPASHGVHHRHPAGFHGDHARLEDHPDPWPDSLRDRGSVPWRVDSDLHSMRIRLLTSPERSMSGVREPATNPQSRRLASPQRSGELTTHDPSNFRRSRPSHH